MKKRFVLFLSVCLLFVFLPLPSEAAGVIIDVTAAPYGAAGDGIANDSDAIGAALAAANPGDTVYLPDGTYRLIKSITVGQGVKLNGQSKENSVLRFDRASGSVSMSSSSELSQLTLDGNNVVINGQGAVVCRSVSNVMLQNLIIKNFNLNGPAIYFEGVSNSDIRNNQILNTGVSTLYGDPLVSQGGKDWGAGMRIGYHSSNIRIIGNLIENTGRGGILCNDDATHLVIRENIIRGSSINNPKRDGIGGEGLGIELHTGCNDSVVEDNIVDRWLSIVRSQYVAARRNIVDASLPPGMTSQGQDYYGLEICTQNSVYTGNYTVGHWEGMAINGIDTSNIPKNNYFGNNVFDSPGQFGAEIFATDGYRIGEVSNLYFYQNQFVNASRKFVTGMEGAGVSLRSNVKNLTFESCMFGNGRLGVLFQKEAGLDGLFFDSCRFWNNTSNGGQNGLQRGGVMTLDYANSVFTGFETVDLEVSGNEDDTLPQNVPFSSDKPVAAFLVSHTGVKGESVRFYNQSVDGDGIETFLWDFGDGAPSGEVNPSHIYERDGIYTVTLTVWDKTGRASRTSQKITVGQKPDWDYAFRDMMFKRDGNSCMKPQSGTFTVWVQLAKQTQVTSPSYFIVAAYDESGRMLDSAMETFEQTGAAVLQAPLTIPAGETVSSIRSFIWSMDGKLSPECMPFGQ